jgi:dTDP-4-dehydrorhamnose reductase
MIVVGRGYVGRSLAACFGVQPIGTVEALESQDVARSPVVVLAGGMKAIHLCERDPGLAAAKNLREPASIARRVSGTVVYLSTDYVFDGRRGGYAPGDTPNPKTAYGVSKVRGEDAILACPRGLVVRTAHVMSDGCPWVEWLTDRLARGETVSAWQDAYNSPTPVQLLADRITESVAAGTTGIIHAAGTRRTNRLELFQSIAALRGLDASLVEPGDCDDPLVPRDVSLVNA